jgi:transposase
MRPEEEPQCCPHCQSTDFVGHGQRERRVRRVPIGLKPVWLKVEVPRYRCRGCGQLMNEKLDDLRRELVRQAESEDAKVAIKGTRWLLLYRRENLPKSQARQLAHALERLRLSLSPWLPRL